MRENKCQSKVIIVEMENSLKGFPMGNISSIWIPDMKSKTKRYTESKMIPKLSPNRYITNPD